MNLLIILEEIKTNIGLKYKYSRLVEFNFVKGFSIKI